MKMTKKSGDIHLSESLIEWIPKWRHVVKKELRGTVKVLSHTDALIACTEGALRTFPIVDAIGNPIETKREMQLRLMQEAWHIVCRDGIDPALVHEALSVIPEYREMLSPDFDTLMRRALNLDAGEETKADRVSSPQSGEAIATELRRVVSELRRLTSAVRDADPPL